MTTIVVPLDGSVFAERALRPAYSLAARLEGARVLLMSCAPEDRDVIRRHLDDRAALYSAVVDTETRLLDDDQPADAILATITSEPDTTLCMATHGRGAILASVLGSVAKRVVCRSTQPLVLVGPACRTALLPAEQGRLLVCCDGSTFSNSIIPTAATWLARLQLEPWLVEVVPPDENVESPRQPARNRQDEAAIAAPRPAVDTPCHATLRRKDAGPPRSAESFDRRVRRTAPRGADRDGNPRPRRTHRHAHGQRRHRGRPPRTLPDPDHETADGHPGVPGRRLRASGASPRPRSAGKPDDSGATRQIRVFRIDELRLGRPQDRPGGRATRVQLCPHCLGRGQDVNAAAASRADSTRTWGTRASTNSLSSEANPRRDTLAAPAAAPKRN